MATPKPPSHPPKTADRFLQWFCRPELLEEIKGDLHEFYETELAEQPRWQAQLIYWYHIFHFLRPFAIRRKRQASNSLMMYRNYCKFAWRSIRLDAFFSSINIMGMGLGLAACLLIFQYLSREWNYDTFHPHYENTFRVKQTLQREGITVESATTFSSLAPTLSENYPSVTATCRLHQLKGGATVQYGDQLFREEAILGADSTFFSLFNFPFLYGDPRTALTQANSIVITESMAKKYFGSDLPLGKELTIDGAYGFWTNTGYQDWNSYTVSGVIEDLPELTHLDFDFLIALNLYPNLEQELKNWGDSFYTYFQINDPGQLSVISDDLPKIAQEFRPDQGIELSLQKMQSIHLTSDLINEIQANGNAQLTYLLALAAFIILLIAGTNYINFSTAKAINRQEEVGVRKIFGAKPSQLFQQMLVESFLLNALGMGLGLAIIYLGQAPIMTLLGFSFSDLINSASFWWTLTGLLLVGTLISGLYPAYQFSRQNLGRLIGQKMSIRRSPERRRQLLIVFQFSISILVIGCAVVMYQQMDFVRHKDLGIDLDRTLVINGPTINQENDTLYYQRMNSFRQEARRIGGVREIAVANFIPGKEIAGTARGYVRPLGTAEELAKSYSFTKVGFDFMPAMDINLLSGRFFDAQFAGDRTFGESVILNEEASRQLGFATPQAAIGQRIVYRVNSTPTIVGVVEDFHQYSLQRNFQAIIFEPTLIPQSYYYLKLSGTDKTRIPELKALWETHFGGNAFSYFFLDEFYAAQYQRENRFMRAFNLFSLLAILVSAMGFFGLVYYSATKRTKEIGIRRTFGAAYWDIFSILAKGLGLLILLSSVISIPLVYLLSGDWLTHYAFRIEIAWWMLLLPVGLLVSITLLIVFLQSLQSYRMNPVAALREE